MQTYTEFIREHLQRSWYEEFQDAIDYYSPAEQFSGTIEVERCLPKEKQVKVNWLKEGF